MAILTPQTFTLILIFTLILLNFGFKTFVTNKIHIFMLNTNKNIVQ